MYKMKFLYLTIYNIFLVFMHLCIYFMVDLDNQHLELKFEFLRSGYTYAYLLCIVIPFSIILSLIIIQIKRRFSKYGKLILFINSLIIVGIQSAIIYKLIKENLVFMITYSIFLVLSFYFIFTRKNISLL